MKDIVLTGVAFCRQSKKSEAKKAIYRRNIFLFSDGFFYLFNLQESSLS